MKILFIIGSLNQGGAEYQILELAKLFQEKGHKVELFAITDYSFYKPFIKENNLKYSHLLNSQSPLKRIYLTTKKVRKEKPDLIVSYLKRVSQVALFAKIFSGVKTKIIIGERTSDIQPRYDRYHFNLMRLANAITVNSISKLDYLQNNFLGIKNKTYFFPNILDVTKIPFKEKISVKTGLHIGFLGRISREKNILEMIQAIALLNQKNILINFSIYGDARSPSYLDEVNSLIKLKKLEDVVILKGRTNNVLEVYSQIDLLILISDYEGFSNVISEGLSSGLPIITSDIPENRYLVEDKVNGFVVNHRDPEDIARGIEKYSSLSPQQKQEIRVANRRKAMQVFDRENLYEQYMNLIKNL